MTEEVVSHGNDFRVTKLDRSFGGHRKTVLNINGENGAVDYNTDVTIKGQLKVNGVTITGTGGGVGGWNTVSDTLTARPLRLSHTPETCVRLYVNGQLQHESDYAIDANNFVIWKSQDFSISSTDLVVAVYEI